MKKIYLNFKTILLILPFVLITSAKAQLITLGSGTNSGGNTVAGPINEYYSSLHCQMVYTAAEIAAAGGTAGPITKFGFSIATGVSTPLPNYTIKMKLTAAANVATYDGVGLTQVYTTPAYTPVAGGFDLLTLNAPFTWNGTSNILVDVCFDQTAQDYATGQVLIYTPNVANGFIFIRSDVAPQCGVACSTTSNKKPQAQLYFPYPLDLGVSAFLKPNLAKRCFGNDTIRVTVMNNGTTNVNFATQPATVTVKATGPTTATYTLLLNSGSLGSLASLDTTITTSFNMSLLGTYKLKGYTTFPFDGNATNDTTVVNAVRQPFFSLSSSPNDSVCRGVPVQLNAIVTQTATIGTGTLTNSSTSYPAPYGNFYNGAKNQFLILASELNAAGLTPGNITSIGFNAVNLNGTVPLINFGLSMGATTLTSLTSFQTGLTPVYSSASYTPVLGINSHVLSTSFVWNGTDNIIVESCFNNYPNGYTNNVSVTQSTTTFNSSLYYYSDTSPMLCSAPGAPTTAMQRPNITFGQPPISGLTYSWSPNGAGLSAANISNPIASNNVEGSTVYTVTVNNVPQNCMSYDTLRIFVKQTPTLNLGHDTTVCTQSYLLNGGLQATSYQWSTGATTNTISVTNTGYYSATATSSVGCVKKDTVHVAFNSVPIVTLGHDTAFCQGSFVELNSGNPTSSHIWGKVGGGFSATTSTVNVNTAGTYYAVVTSSLSTSCTARDTIVVTSKTGPNVSLAFNSPPILLCQFSSSRTLNEGTPAGGTYIGPGVSGNSFNPALVGPGTYVIVYTYTGPNSCTSQAQDTLKVKACVGIEEYANSMTLNIYPNPSKGAFTIAVNSNSDVDAALQILTIDSRVVYEDHISAGAGLYEKQVNISGLADGIYYLKMQSANASKTYKIIKQ